MDRHKAGELLGVTPRQVLRYVDKGWLTKHKKGNRVRYSRYELHLLNRHLRSDTEGFVPVQRAS